MRRESLLALEQAVSRRAFLSRLVKTTALAASLDRLSPSLFGITRPTEEERKTALKVYSAIGNLTIPVDEDPGWIDFDPGISEYGLNVMIGQVFLNGDKDALDGFIDALNQLNKVPEMLSYNLKFLEMSRFAQNKYITDILTGQFENDGWQDILNLAGGLGVVSCKVVFFSNYPRHLAQPGSEYQVLPASRIKTGWDIMGFRGPIGPDEERRLREKYANVEEVAGIDPTNPYV